MSPTMTGLSLDDTPVGLTTTEDDGVGGWTLIQSRRLWKSSHRKTSNAGSGSSSASSTARLQRRHFHSRTDDTSAMLAATSPPVLHLDSKSGRMVAGAHSSPTINASRRDMGRASVVLTAPIFSATTKMISTPSISTVHRKLQLKQRVDALNCTLDELHRMVGADGNAVIAQSIVSLLSNFANKFEILVESAPALPLPSSTSSTFDPPSTLTPTSFVTSTDLGIAQTVRAETGEASRAIVDTDARSSDDAIAIIGGPAAVVSVPEKKRSWADVATFRATDSSVMSPSKNALTREMLEKKQLRAEAARNESLKTREIKSQSLSSKINRVLTKKEEERRQLQRQLEDRLTEAEQRRSTILHERRGKTKEERAQQEFTKVTHDKKKVAAVEREEKIRARKMELEAGRQRKAEENAAKEEAALVRRNSMEKRRLAKLQINEEKRRELELRKEQERLAVLTLKEQEREEKARRLAEFKTVQVTTVHILKQEIDRKMEKGTRIHDEHVDLVKEKALAVCDKAREVASRKTPQKQHHDSPRLRNHPLSAGRDESFATAPSPDRGSSATTKAGPNALAINYCPWYLALSNSLPPDHASSSDHVIKSLSTLGKELAAVLMPSKKRDLRAVEMLCGHGCQVLSTATSFPAATDLDHFFGRKVPSVPTTLTQLFTLVAGMGAAEAESYPCIFAFVAKLLIAAQSAPPGKASGSYQGQLPVDSVLSAIRLLATILRESVQTSQIAMRLCSSVMCIVRHALIDGSSGGYEAASKDVVSDLFGVILEEGVITLLHSTFLTIGGNASDVGYMDFIGTAIALLETVTSIMGSRVHCTATYATSMFDTLCRSEFVGVVTLLDSLFLNANNNATIFMEAYQTTLKISHDAVRMLNHIANVDCVRFQNTLGGARDSHAESGAASVRNTVKRSSAVSGYEASVLQNEFYHLVQFWLNTWMRDHAKAKAAVAMAQTDASGNVVNGSRDSTSPGAKRLRTSLLHEVILLIGFYVQGSSKNQQLVRIGQYPVILQQLTSLPFHYFCMPGLANVLFPTLIAACYGDENNLTILRKEMSPELLQRFIQDKIEDEQRDGAVQPPQDWTVILDPAHRYRHFHMPATAPSMRKPAAPTASLSATTTATRFDLSKRVPIPEWTQASAWFGGVLDALSTKK